MVEVSKLVLGQGPLKVIVVHGWMAGRQLFDPMHTHLNSEDFSYVFMDCRGYGDRIDSHGPFNVRTIAEDILELANRLGWTMFSVLGHSMAGMSAQWLLHVAGERIQSIVLLSTVPASGAKITEERRSLLKSAVEDSDTRRTLIDINTGHRQSTFWLNQTLAISLQTTCPDALTGYLQSWTRDDLTAKVQGVSTPVLAIVGEFDPGATLEVMEQKVLPMFPGCRCELLPGVGHYAMREDPKALVRSVEGFIRSVVSSS
ncbi:alpha/beta fold hydrolase [Pseudomonas neuropathica]